MAKGRNDLVSANLAAVLDGQQMAHNHPLIHPLPPLTVFTGGPSLELGRDEWVRVTCIEPGTASAGSSFVPEMALHVFPNLRRRAEPAEWAYVLARLRLHAALNHMDPLRQDGPWHMASWYAAERMIAEAGIGRRPADLAPVPSGYPREEAALAAQLRDGLSTEPLEGLSLSSPGRPFWSFQTTFEITDALKAQRAKSLAQGVRVAASQAIAIAGGAIGEMRAVTKGDSVAKAARDWAISNFPLLGALASAFTLVEDEAVCASMRIEIAAISDEAQEIYINPRVRMSEEEARFVLAHELLHAGLRHVARRQGRDPWYWNVACDFVINGWLIEMEVGTPPEKLGYLYDPDLKGASAEEVYDRIVSDLRWMRRLKKARTLNGAKPDMMEGDHGPRWWVGGGADLDAFYRRALSEGLDLHLNTCRGYLPAGLVEEIRSLLQPPIPWDVALAQWLDQYFPPLERRRTFARAHRRQAATPDIARPAWVAPEEARQARVFGAVVDTSGSMDRVDLGKAIGAIASYAMSREVRAVRLIECDAAAHDAGYVLPEALLQSVRVRGRGGTVLMPGIRHLETSRDFPKDGPILIVTDGACDTLTIRREHAFLLAAGGRLPFQAKGPVFRMA
ncbi:MAG: VWA-like domain-containing protein [Pseudomonadota bacterium]